MKMGGGGGGKQNPLNSKIVRYPYLQLLRETIGFKAQQKRFPKMWGR